MMEAINYVWYERSQQEGWSVGLTERGKIDLSLGAGQDWQARPLRLHTSIPIGVFDALIKHKGETRRFLADLNKDKE